MEAATPASQTATAYAQALLRDLSATPRSPLSTQAQHPAVAWASSGLMWLTGAEEPLMCPAPLASCADGALAALASLGPAFALDGLQGARLLSERAALLGLRRNAPASLGGACRLYVVADGTIALNLAREDDRQSLAAWLDLDAAPDPSKLPQLLVTRSTSDLVERGRLLGLALAAVEPPPAQTPAWFRVHAEGQRRASAPARPPRVLELASLWAGPLCGHLLLKLGAEVIKIESPQRPDGARRGNAEFFSLLNAGKRSVAIDPRTAEGRAQLLALIATADIVIEGSRPRALRQLGIEAETLVQGRAGLTWISLTGYGRDEPQAQWVAYGDDAAVAAGLTELMRRATGEWLICGDAIADPLTGVHAALAAWASWQSGGGRLIGLALRDVVAHAIGFDRTRSADELRARQREWTALAMRHGVCEPRARHARLAAQTLGADTAAVLATC